MAQPAAPLGALKASAYRIPTDAPESDGTLEWDSTTLVLVEVQAGGDTGVGYSYAGTAGVAMINEVLAPCVMGRSALDIPDCWSAMVRAIRNHGRPGVASMAVAAVDNALWDLKGKLLGVPLLQLLGAAREGIAVYGSGGFTSYSDARLAQQLGDWAGAGIGMVKMKVGRQPERDLHRVEVARRAIGDTALFVDANGAYSRKQALQMAQSFHTFGVVWFEEPVSPDDLAGVRLLRNRAPPGMEIADGEYGYDLAYFHRLLMADAVDVVQADATRCAGVTGFMRVAALCEAFNLPLSSHCAPALHVQPCCAAPPMRHMEYFHDHVRIEQMLFDGVVAPHAGILHPDLSRPGLGIEFKSQDAKRYAV